MAAWINFKELRENICIADVLRQYNVELKVRGEKATGLCPLPTHPSRADGTKRSPSFSVHLRKGIWHCFGCGAAGNVLDLGARLQGLDPDEPSQLRKAALKLAEMFGFECHSPEGSGTDPKSHARKPAPIATPAPAAPKTTPEPVAQILVNAPIDFELKNLDPRHSYLTQRELTPETIAYFGLGFCSRGMMKDRIAIPIHDSDLRLVGYAGRLVDDGRIDEEHPRYLFPGQRNHDGIIHEFRKSKLVYNLHRFETVDDLIIVEGFASVWWLHQNEYAHAASVMGNSCSPEQADLIAQHVSDEGHIWLFPDGNDAGTQLAASALPLFASHRFTRLIKLRSDQQPTDCDARELHRLLGVTKSGRSEKPSVAND